MLNGRSRSRKAPAKARPQESAEPDTIRTASADKLRELFHTVKPSPPADTAESHYDDCEFDTAAVLAYCQNKLSPADRKAVETAALNDARLFDRIVQTSALMATSATEHAPAAAEPAHPPLTSHIELEEPHEVGEQLVNVARPEWRKHAPDAPGLEVWRIFESGRDLIRIEHQSLTMGTLLAVNYAEPTRAVGPIPAELVKRCVVLRKNAPTSVTAQWQVCGDWKQKPLSLNLRELPPPDLNDDMAPVIWESFQATMEDDPAALATIDTPRSPWQLWADRIIQMSVAGGSLVTAIPKGIVEVANRIASANPGPGQISFAR